MRGATDTVALAGREKLFQSTRPMRGATIKTDISTMRPRNFNPRAPCGARPRLPSRFREIAYFNPRAPCGARRWDLPTTKIRINYFNPRAPCGARLILRLIIPVSALFQSTRPMRGATATGASASLFRKGFQSTRPMRGATSMLPWRPIINSEFQSTRPMRGAT